MTSQEGRPKAIIMSSKNFMELKQMVRKWAYSCKIKDSKVIKYGFQFDDLQNYNCGSDVSVESNYESYFANTAANASANTTNKATADEVANVCMTMLAYKNMMKDAGVGAKLLADEMSNSDEMSSYGHEHLEILLSTPKVEQQIAQAGGKDAFVEMMLLWKRLTNSSSLNLNQ